MRYSFNYKFPKFKLSYLFYLLAILGAIAFGVFLSYQKNRQVSLVKDFIPNTTIVPATGAYAFENLTNNFKTQFKANPTNAEGIVFSNSFGQIAFYTPAKQVFGDISTKSAAINDGSTLTYPELFPQIDLRYTVSTSRLLEEFIIKDSVTAKKVSRIDQIAKTNNVWMQNDDGSITFTSTDKTAFTLPAPIMYETRDHSVSSKGLVYEVKNNNGELTISKVLTSQGKAWLADKKRIYPIAIDLVIDNADVTDTSSLTIDTGDDLNNWTSSDGTNTPISQETVIRQEGTGSIKSQTATDAVEVSIDGMEYSSDANAQAAYVKQNYVSNTYSATGGTITTSGGYRIHTFTSTGTFTPSAAMDVEILLVAGGGGGGRSATGWGGAGGGGAGGALYKPAFAVTPQAYTVLVGDGGAGATVTGKGTSGTSSTFSTLTAVGGGGGGAGSLGGGLSGGSGGGGAYNGTGGGSGTAEQGFSGGTASGSYGGGGGGAGGAGSMSSTCTGGGAGLVSSISGSSVTYAQGGNTPCGTPTNGAANTGNGGSGEYGNANNAGNGGSGIVIIRYLIQPETVTDSNGYRTHVFSSYDTFNPGGSTNVETLVVAGGGGGGRSASGWGGPGGGGAGGYQYNASFAVTAQNYPIVVGSGGRGADYTVKGSNGTNSSFSTITAIGGGGGGAGSLGGGLAGGSGGGGAYNGTAGGAGTAGQGNNGGTGSGSYGGGGGGSGGAGSAGTNTNSCNGGGAGTSNSISGSAVTYSSGGNTGCTSTINGAAYTGRGGSAGYDTAYNGGNGGSGVVIIKYPIPLLAYSESTIKTAGTYSLKAVAQASTSLNKTLTKTISPLNLSGVANVTFDLRSTRTGSNIKIGLHDTGGTTTEVTPNITSANVFQTINMDLSGVTNANKDAIDQIIITVVDASSANTFYLDNMAVAATSFSVNDTITKTSSPVNLSSFASLTFWVRSSVAGSFATFGFGESAATEQTTAITINQANTWEQKTWDISGIAPSAKDGVTKFAFKFTNVTSGAAFYFDDINAGGFSNVWISSDPVNTPVSTETTIKQEGAASIKILTSAIQSVFTPIDLFEFATDHQARASSITNTITATGGTITNKNGYTIHTFTSSGTFTVTSGSGNVEVLVVAGGGGGGSDMGGGGGGGGVIYDPAYAVTPGAITVTVGTGGAGAPAGISQVRGVSGGNSVFGSLTAIGGGGGGSEYANTGSPPASGGSGGGTSGINGTITPGAGTAGQGFIGGKSLSNYYPGGGGGAGGPGQTNPGNGGAGLPSDINGTLLYWGAGGGGAGYSNIAGNGGLGGAGGGAPKASSGGITGGLAGAIGFNPGNDGTVGTLVAQTNVPGGSAGANTGGGGGGGAHYNSNNAGGAGGSGIVIVRYPTAGYTQSGYVSNAPGINATGGEITYSGGYKIHTFKTDDALNIISGSGNVEALVVAGGGGGGSDMGGGGGGGGVIYNSSYAVTPGKMQVTVGTGGAGAPAGISQVRGVSGGNSVFGSLTAIGGGGGGSEYANTGSPPASGGSGGGTSGVAGTITPGAGTAGQGFIGGKSLSNYYPGGGGGGGGAGGTAPGDGGIGYLSSINGSSLYYGGGGGGSGYSARAGNGGLGGGGGGAPMVSGGGLGGGSALHRGYNAVAGTLVAQTNVPGGNGGPNTGGGGGGGSHYNSNNFGGNGGSGVVIVRYPIPPLEAFSSAAFAATGGTITSSGGNTIHTFTSSGTFSVTAGSEYLKLLTVGGGGGGGANMGGGGGGGGVIYNPSYPITYGSYPVSVGAGGAGATAGIESGPGLNGTKSYFNDQISYGGGGGATNYATNTSPARDGASGGGNSSSANLYPGRGTPGQGYDGGEGVGNYYPGGGGGAGGAGSFNPGNGGIGIQSSINGSALYYGGGGGGSGYSTNSGNGGLGGGGGGAPKVNGGGLGGGSALNSGSDGTVGTLVAQTNVPGGAGGANTGGGGGGGSHYNSNNAGGAGGSGVVIVSYPTPVTVKSEGSYALKIVARASTSANKTLTRTIASPINLSSSNTVTFDIRASRTGSNVKVGLHDSGGTTTEVTPNITQANVFQSATIDLSVVAPTNKDAIDQIIITIVDDASDNTIYIDNMLYSISGSSGDTVSRTSPITDLSGVANLTFWVRSNVAGTFANFGFGESAINEQTTAITINQANTWEQKTWDISGISGASRDAVTKFGFTFTSDTNGAAFYFDDIQSNALFTPTMLTPTRLTPTSIRWNFTDNSSEETGFKLYDSSNTLMVTCAGTNLSYCDETGLNPNTQYTRKIGTYNSSFTTISSTTTSLYTSAATPLAPSVSNRAATTIQVDPNIGTNPANTQFAIYRESGTTCDGSGGVYILASTGASNGSTADWQTDATWGNKIMTGLSSETTYSFCVKARNADGIETSFSPVGSYNDQSGYIPISGDYVFTPTGATNSSAFVNRYRNGTNSSRYVFGVDNGATPNTALFEIRSGILTINQNDTLVVGKLSLTGGSIAIATGGEISSGQGVWMVDADVDGFSADGKLYIGSQPTGGRRKNLATTLGTLDCNDNIYDLSNSSYGNQYVDSDGDGFGVGSPIYACASAGYSPANGDCDDNNASSYPRNLYTDTDGDGYGNPNSSIFSCPTAGYVADNTDCGPTDANAKPGSSYCSTTTFTNTSGAQSYDWDCSASGGSGTQCGTPIYNSNPQTQWRCVKSNFYCVQNSITNCLGTQVGCGQSGYLDGSPSFGYYGWGSAQAPGENCCFNNQLVCTTIGAAGTQSCN